MFADRNTIEDYMVVELLALIKDMERRALMETSVTLTEISQARIRVRNMLIARIVRLNRPIVDKIWYKGRVTWEIDTKRWKRPVKENVSWVNS